VSGHFLITDHTADIGIEVEAPDLASLFEQAALGTFSLGEGPAPNLEPVKRTLELKEASVELLLRAFLAELLYLYEVERFYPCTVRVEKVSQTNLQAEATGVVAPPGTALPRLPLKAVTYHNLSVAQTPDGDWKATVLFDV